MNRLLETRWVLVFILALGLFAMAAQHVTDPDVWWHLRTGQLILQNHAVFHADTYSFTRYGQPWVNHEWLSDVFIFCLYRAAGWAGLIVTFASITACVFLLVFWRCPGRTALGVLVTALAALASAPIWGVRPQILSLLLISLFLLILDASAKRPHVVWWIPPIVLLWVNLHAGYAVGIALVLWALAGHALDASLGFENWAQAVLRIKRLALVLAVSLALVPLNPYGFKMYGYPLATLHSPAMRLHIAEWFSPDFHQPQYWPAMLMILASVAAVAWAPRRLRPSSLALLLVTMCMGLYSVRHLAIYAIVAAPVLSELLDAALATLRPEHCSQVQSSAGLSFVAKAGLNAIVLVAVAVYAATHVQHVLRSQANAEAARFPIAAVNFLATHQLPGPLFNYYDWGGYLVWRLYPGYGVYIDGRADLYGDSFMNRFAATYGLTGDWVTPLRAWRIRTVLLPPNSALATALKSLPEWKEVYGDSQAVVLTRSPWADQSE